MKHKPANILPNHLVMKSGSLGVKKGGKEEQACESPASRLRVAVVPWPVLVKEEKGKEALAIR